MGIVPWERVVADYADVAAKTFRHRGRSPDVRPPSSPSSRPPKHAAVGRDRALFFFSETQSRLPLEARPLIGPNGIAALQRVVEGPPAAGDLGVTPLAELCER